MAILETDWLEVPTVMALYQYPMYKMYNPTYNHL